MRRFFALGLFVLVACGDSPDGTSDGGNGPTSSGPTSSGPTSTTGGGGGASSGVTGGGGTVGAGGSGGAPTGATVVATQMLEQDWTEGFFEPATVTVDVIDGDAIIAVGMHWDASGNFGTTAPTVTPGTFETAVDQGPEVGNNSSSPPVYAQIHYVLNAMAGSYTITPPELGGGSGDGTLYIAVVRGLSASPMLVATGSTIGTGNQLADVSVGLDTQAQPGDFVIAVGGEDNTMQIPAAGISDPPAGWMSLGVQDDASWNVPSEACYRVAPSAGTQSVTWSWTDPNVNVVTAAVAAFR